MAVGVADGIGLIKPTRRFSCLEAYMYGCTAACVRVCQTAWTAFSCGWERRVSGCIDRLLRDSAFWLMQRPTSNRFALSCSAKRLWLRVRRLLNCRSVILASPFVLDLMPRHTTCVLTAHSIAAIPGPIHPFFDAEACEPANFPS
jgi:hypothetical protein